VHACSSRTSGPPNSPQRCAVTGTPTADIRVSERLARRSSSTRIQVRESPMGYRGQNPAGAKGPRHRRLACT
jgi:hypothetical protein